jgi:hypothetical protein
LDFTNKQAKITFFFSGGHRLYIIICKNRVSSDKEWEIKLFKSSNKQIKIPCWWTSNKNSCAQCHAPLSCSTKASSNQSIQSIIYACIRQYNSMIFSSNIRLRIKKKQIISFEAHLSKTNFQPKMLEWKE